jgi:cell division protein FtsQ
VKFFRKKNSAAARGSDRSPSRRRNTRLLLLQLRKFALLGSVVALVSGAGFTAWHNNTFKKCGAWLASEALVHSANAGFTVKDILVTGRKQVSAAGLLASLSVKEGMPIFGFNIADAEKSLSTISWVQSAVISRRLPDTIVVELHERVPVALWQHNKKIFLIDKDGTVLSADNLGAWQQLPLVVGEGAEKHVVQLLGLLQAEPVIASDLVSAVRVEDRRWDLHLNNGIIVKLPERDTELAISRLASLEKQKNILGRNVSNIDLRQPERVMITPGAAEKTKTNI